MKEILKRIFCIVLAIVTLPTSAFAENEYRFTAKKAAVRIENAGQLAECIVSAEDRSLFGYKAQLVYDKDMFELVDAEPMYIKGEPSAITYYSDNLPEGLAYNVPDSKVYINDGTKCGYFGYESYPGMYRSISVIMGFDGRAEGNDVLRITLKSKKAGDGFIYITDEETSSLTDDKTVIPNSIETSLTVKVDGDSYGSTTITDAKDIAYPWRRAENVVLQTVGEQKKDEALSGMRYDVSYKNKEIDIDVLKDGTVVCSVPAKLADGTTPIVARASAFGGFKRAMRISYDDKSEMLSFVAEDFGEYIVAEKSYKLLDCAENTDEYKAVCYLKSIGVIDEASETFAPKRSITRAELVKMLVCCVGAVDASALVWFDDVSLADWHYKYIATAVKMGIIDESGKHFRPDSAISGSETKEMLCRVSELINGSDKIDFNKQGLITRGEAAEAIQNMLLQKLR